MRFRMLSLLSCHASCPEGTDPWKLLETRETRPTKAACPSGSPRPHTRTEIYPDTRYDANPRLWRHARRAAQARGDVLLGRPLVADREPEHVAAVQPRVREEELAASR